MDTYQRDIFYDVNRLPVSKIKQLLREARAMSYHWHIDKLDCSVSLARQPVNVSFTDIMKRCVRKTHYVFIHRKGYENWDWRLETGFRTMGIEEDLFLWINVRQERIPELVRKYGLKPL